MFIKSSSTKDRTAQHQQRQVPSQNLLECSAIAFDSEVDYHVKQNKQSPTRVILRRKMYFFFFKGNKQSTASIILDNVQNASSASDLGSVLCSISSSGFCLLKMQFCDYDQLQFVVRFLFFVDTKRFVFNVITCWRYSYDD